jgi:hypothetical protein
MKTMKRTTLAAIAGLLLLAGRGASSQEEALAMRSSVDWETRVLTLRIELDVARAGIRLPAGRLEAERLVERELADLAKEAVFALAVDSHRSVGDTIADGSLDVNGLIELASRAKRGEASFSRDMRSFSAEYAIPLGSVAGLYAGGREAVPLPAPLGYSPSRAYTGILIYAQGELPVRGERVSGSLRPCLFPRIYDEGMRPILDRDRVDPAILVGDGPVGYAPAVKAAAEGRVGDDPLRVMAKAVFGANRTDLVLSVEDADRILALPENRDLVRRGRILVILDVP